MRFALNYEQVQIIAMVVLLYSSDIYHRQLLRDPAPDASVNGLSTSMNASVHILSFTLDYLISRAST